MVTILLVISRFLYYLIFVILEANWKMKVDKIIQIL